MGRFACAARIGLFGLIGVLGAQAEPMARADEAERPLEISAVLGGHFFSDTNALGRSTYAAPNSNLANSVAVGGRFGYALSRYFLLEAEFLAMPTKLASNDAAQALAYTGRGHLLFRWPFGPKKMIQPFVLLGGGALAVRPDPGLPLSTETLGTFHAGLGLRVNVAKWVGVRVDGRMVLVPEVGTPTFTQDYEFLASVYARFGFTPDKPTHEKPIDVDNDGIPDHEDKCPAESGPKENLGCPDKDGDGDTVVDRLDKCPTQSGPAENSGCPDTDADADGVVDRLDQCPNEVGPKANKGCPDKDTDNDGIVDRLDKCPNEPETKNGWKDSDGCPDEVPPEIAKFTGVIAGIKFLPNKAVLTKESMPVLDEAVAVMTQHPSIRYEVSGHTDNIGQPADNMLLSQQRADAVRTYILSKGIAEERVTATGFGSTNPIADNKTVAGRAQNRRVEFKLLPPLPRKRQTAAPGTPAAPGAPSAPGQFPAAPGAPQAPGLPEAPQAPAIPGAPQAPAIPQAPAVPQAPAIPQAPAVPPPPSVAPPAVPPPPAPSMPPEWAPQQPAPPAVPSQPVVPPPPPPPVDPSAPYPYPPPPANPS